MENEQATPELITAEGVATEEQLYLGFGFIVQHMLSGFLEQHPEVTEGAQIALLMRAFGYVQGELTGISCEINNIEVTDHDELTRRRYLDNAGIFDAEITQHIAHGQEFLAERYPGLRDAVDNYGEPSLNVIVEEIVGNTFFHFFGIRRIPIEPTEQLPQGAHAFVIERDAPWKIAGLDNAGSVSNVDDERVQAIYGSAPLGE